MSERRTETIDIGKGIQYAKVAARSAEFHADNKECSIQTTCEFKEGFALFSAKVETKKGIFTGHSMGKVGQQKAFEKLETIAVGRALAFAGYLADGEIATYEEMEDLVTEAQLNSLKGKYFSVNETSLKGADYPARREAFNQWCREILDDGEGETDYLHASSWSHSAYIECWRNLTGATPDVPFEE